METRTTTRQIILNAKGATGVGSVMNVASFKNIMLEVATANSANLTINIAGSFAVDAPTFSSSASLTNPWFYIGSYNLADSSLVAGSTGYGFTGTDGVKGLLVNTDGLIWLNVIVTARAAGDVTVTGICFNNH